MGPFLSVIVAAFASVWAAGEVRGTAGAGPLTAAAMAVFVGLAASGGAARAARRVRLGIPAMRVEGAERLLDLATFLAFVWASPWPETVRAGSPTRALDAILIFLPYWAAATARFAGAVRARSDVAEGREEPAPLVDSHARLLAAVVAPVLLIAAVGDALDGIHGLAAVFAAYPSIGLGASLLGMLAAMWAAPLVLRVVLRARPVDDDPELKADCDEACRTARFPLGFVGIVDTSRSIVNAAYVGWALPFRAVFFSDALLRLLDRRSRRAVFAHELGHGVRRHLLFLVLGISSLGLLAAGFLPDVDALAGGAAAAVAAATGSAEAGAAVGTGIGVVLLGLLPLAGAFWLLTYVSRRFETEADLFAAELVGDPEAFVAALDDVQRTLGPGAERDGFRHFGVPRRIAIVRAVAADPAEGARWRRTFRRIRLAVALAFSIAVLRLAAGWPEESATAPVRAVAALMERFDAAMRAGNLGEARELQAIWTRSWAAGDPIGDFNRVHAAAQLAAVGDDAAAARLAASELVAALERLSAAIERGEFKITPESKLVTEREVRFMAALADVAPAPFDPDAFASARAWSALRAGPGEVPTEAARLALSELPADDAWRRLALAAALRRRGSGDPASELRAKYAFE